MLARSQDRITMILPSDREIVLTRVFDAPRRLVFEAWTRPEHVRRWYGCRAFEMTACEIDLSVGGAWRYVLRGPDGVTHTMRGCYREISPPGRLVFTEQYAAQGFTSTEALVRVLFAEHDGMTTFLLARSCTPPRRIAMPASPRAWRWARARPTTASTEHLATMA